MASINKSDAHFDRATHGGKGDLHRGNIRKFSEALYWKRSSCCNAHVGVDKIKATGLSIETKFLICKGCGNPCQLKP